MVQTMTNALPVLVGRRRSKEQSEKKEQTRAVNSSLVQNSRLTRLDVTFFNGLTRRLIQVPQDPSHPFNQIQIQTSQTTLLPPPILLLHSQTRTLPLTRRNVSAGFRL
jgi:hypothetical protein